MHHYDHHSSSIEYNLPLRGKKFSQHNLLKTSFKKKKDVNTRIKEVKGFEEFYSLRRETKYNVRLQESGIRRKFKFCSSSSY